MIEPTDEMAIALLRAMPFPDREMRKPEDVLPWVAAMLAIVERDYELTWRTCFAKRHGADNICQIHGCVYPGEKPGVRCRSRS